VDPPTDLIARGGQIYLQGRLGDGSPLQGRRTAGRPPSAGADAACVNCHLHSGLGATEGRDHIPPITGRFLTPPHKLRADKPDLPYVENLRARGAYTPATAARAIRDGVDADGRTMGNLMPRYALGDEDMAALLAYLDAMDRPVQPGVSDKLLHFATIVTPDADPARRDAMLAVLHQFLKDKNDKAFTIGPTGPYQPTGRMMASKMLYMAPRRWDLQVWELTGPPAGWVAQLEADYARQPVLAVVSGIGGTDWAPVHEFCVRDAVPCIFPNVDLPVDGPNDFYPMYFSGGLALEADLIAARIGEAVGPGKPAVRQVYRAGSPGEIAAGMLAKALEARGIEAKPIPIAGEGAATLEAGLRQAGDADDLVLWLKAPDVARLGAVPPRPQQIFLSGRLGGYEQMPLPPDWRARAQLVFGVDLPDRRSVRTRYAEDWLRIRGIPVTDLAVQSDTWLACSILTETLNEMIDAFIPEYLVERIQQGLDHRFISGYYPRLSLGEHQRFASKGGYMVRFAKDSGPQVLPVGNWFVP
jgi:hypothetical protein